MIDKKILFVHIPKTAGTSINSYLTKNYLNAWYMDTKMKIDPRLFQHAPFYLYEENIDLQDVFTFTVVRNPYTRAFSHYNHIKDRFKIRMTFNDFLKYIKFNLIK